LTNLKKRKYGKPGCKKEDNIDKDLNGIEKQSLKWFNLAKDRNKLQAAKYSMEIFLRFYKVRGSCWIPEELIS